MVMVVSLSGPAMIWNCRLMGGDSSKSGASLRQYSHREWERATFFWERTGKVPIRLTGREATDRGEGGDAAHILDCMARDRERSNYNYGSPCNRRLPSSSRQGGTPAGVNEGACTHSPGAGPRHRASTLCDACRRWHHP